MLESFSTNATVAKSRAIYGKRLTNDDYKELMRRNTVTEIAEYLKRNTHYRKILASIDTTTIHRGFLETLLRRDTFDLYVNLCKFQHLGNVPFYNYKVIMEEISEIVSCILHLNAKASDNYIESLPSYLMDHASFNLIELAKARSYSEILSVLKKTPYYDIIKDFVPDENGLYDCSLIESKLFTYYLKWMKSAIDSDFSNKIAQDMHRQLKTQIDLINIISGFRMKAFSNADDKEIEEYTLKFYGRLSKNKQRELFSSEDADEYIKRFQKTYYGSQMEMFDEPLSKDLIDKYAHALRAKYAKITLRQTQAAPISVYNIVFLFEIEVENIINIIEGIRYKAPLAYIEKLLIL